MGTRFPEAGIEGRRNSVADAGGGVVADEGDLEGEIALVEGLMALCVSDGRLGVEAAAVLSPGNFASPGKAIPPEGNDGRLSSFAGFSHVDCGLTGVSPAFSAL